MEGETTTRQAQSDVCSLSRQVKPRCIIFIDDNNLVLETVKKLLEGSAYDLQLCEDVFTGLGKLVSHQAVTVFIDAGMEQLSGYQFCALVKAQIKFRHVRLVIILQQSDELSQAKAIAAGANAVVVKPFGKTELINLIQNIGTLAA